MSWFLTVQARYFQFDLSIMLSKDKEGKLFMTLYFYDGMLTYEYTTARTNTICNLIKGLETMEIVRRD